MRQLTPATRCRDSPTKLSLRELCQQYADERWVAAHLTPEQAAESVLDEFKRAVRQELELLEVECRDE
ncbi:MAG TPA: hypothetical protein VMP01_08185 [Pirellulaceae bacterium]|nr:hypothetical protein [Pirellulaceae bacterium]